MHHGIIYLTIESCTPVGSAKAQRRLTVWPGYDVTSWSTFTRWPEAPEQNKDRDQKKKHYSQCFPLNTNYRRKQRKGTVLVQSKDKWGHYGSVCDTQDSITELRQVGQESGTSPWQCVRGQIGGGGKRSCVLGEREKKKRRRRKASSFLPIGHKSCGWVMLFYSLPFSVPTHSCVTAKSQNKYAFLSAFCQWVCEKQNERRSFRTTICASVCVSVSVCV